MLYQGSWMEVLNNYIKEQEEAKKEKECQPMTEYFNKLLPEEVKEIARKSARRSRLRR